MQAKRKQPGVRVRHSRSCPAASSREVNCRCSPSYEAWAFSVRDGKKVRKTFPTLAAAKGWRADATSAIRKGAMREHHSARSGGCMARGCAGGNDPHPLRRPL